MISTNVEKTVRILNYEKSYDFYESPCVPSMKTYFAVQLSVCEFTNFFLASKKKFREGLVFNISKLRRPLCLYVLKDNKRAVA